MAERHRNQELQMMVEQHAVEIDAITKEDEFCREVTATANLKLGMSCVQFERNEIALNNKLVAASQQLNMIYHLFEKLKEGADRKSELELATITNSVVLPIKELWRLGILENLSIKTIRSIYFFKANFVNVNQHASRSPAQFRVRCFPKGEWKASTLHLGSFLSCGQVKQRSTSILTQSQEKLLKISLLCVFFMIAEIVGGYMANSIAIISDAGHLLSDLLSFFVGIGALKLASRGKNKDYLGCNSNFTFGYHRSEVFGALVSICIVWLLTLWLLYEAVERFIHPPTEFNAGIMLMTAFLGIIVNLVMGFTLHQGTHAHFHTHIGGGQCGGHHGHNHSDEPKELESKETITIAGCGHHHTCEEEPCLHPHHHEHEEGNCDHDHGHGNHEHHTNCSDHNHEGHNHDAHTHEGCSHSHDQHEHHDHQHTDQCNHGHEQGEDAAAHSHGTIASLNVNIQAAYVHIIGNKLLSLR
jgi:cation diffusion facilitator family transporter